MTMAVDFLAFVMIVMLFLVDSTLLGYFVKRDESHSQMALGYVSYGKIILEIPECCCYWFEWFNFVRKYNFDVLEKNAADRQDGVPLVTVCNHSSCLDDPCLWGLTKIRNVLNTRKKVRWTLVAHELLFSTPFRSSFFSRAKAIPVVRGDGVYQKGVDVAIEQLNKGEWVHVFPEGGINVNDAIKRLKWGVGRLIAESQVTPIVVPFWHEGMDDVLPNRSPYIPKIMKRVTVLIGEPMEFAETVEEYRKAKKSAMETRKHITDLIQERFKELKEETQLLHSKWR